MISSLVEKISQTAMMLITSDTVPASGVGGIYVGGQIITKAQDKVNTVIDTVNKYKAAATTPLLIASDFENGCGSMINGLTSLPYLMSLGATADEKLAYNYGVATALEAKTVGANWSFSPVCDLSFNPRNPLVNVRAISDDATLAARLLKQLVKGMQDNGLAACAKHFPGDGVDWRDQHIVTTVNSLSKDEWLNTYGFIYKELLDAYSVMIGHIRLPAYQTDNLPASLSYELITNLLKNELEYKGVAISDAVDMGGYAGYFKKRVQAEVESLKAGCDMVLWPSDDYVDNAVQAVQDGYISTSRIDDAYNRVMTMKEKLGLFKESGFKTLTLKEKELIAQTETQIAENSITLIKDDKKAFPFKKNCKIAVVPITHYEPAYELVDVLKDELEKYGAAIEIFKTKQAARKLRQDSSEYDYIIYALFSRPFRPQGPIDFMAEEAAKLWTVIQQDQDKVVVVSFGSPYFINQYFEREHCYVNAYSMIPSSVRAFAKAAFGKAEFMTFSPIKT